MGTFFQDIRYGIRTLSRSRAFTAVAIVTLALGIGANTAIFSVVNAVLLRPLPYPNPERLALVWERNVAIGKDRDPVAPLNFLDWQKQATEFEGLAGFRYSGFTLTGVEFPEQVGTLTVTSNLFRTLGVEPIIGRTFTEDEVQSRARVVVLSHAFWMRRYGGDPALVGKPIRLDGVAYTVVGVMPPSFVFPDGHSAIETYSPLIFNQGDLTGRRSHTMTVVGRLRNGASIDSAQAQLAAIARAIATADSTSNPEVEVVAAHENMVEDVRLGLVVLLCTVGFVLLIACANVANLLLARSAARRREIAVRTSLGAGRWRVARQLLTESLMLALAGGAAGTFFAWWTLGLFVRFSPPDLPRMDQVSIDSRVFLFTAAISVITGLLFGLVPALHH